MLGFDFPQPIGDFLALVIFAPHCSQHHIAVRIVLEVTAFVTVEIVDAAQGRTLRVERRVADAMAESLTGVRMGGRQSTQKSSGFVKDPIAALFTG